MPPPRITVVPINPRALGGSADEVIRDAADILKRGTSLVAFPTETVYGLGARGLHKEEVARIFEMKGRPAAHPIILHVDGEEMARTVASVWSPLAAKLAKEFWPGPLTLVVPRNRDVVPDEVTGGLDTVGIRAPQHPVALALIRAVGEPLAAPSANAHTHISPTTAEHVVRSLEGGGHAGEMELMVLDAGPCAHGIESTVLDLSVTPPRVLRPGAVSIERLREVEPTVSYDAHSPAITLAAADAPRASPGLAAKHYAPRARVVLTPRGAIYEALGREKAAPAMNSADAIAVLVATKEGQAAAATQGVTHCTALPDNPEGYAHNVFAALHAMDAIGASVIVIERVPEDDPAWLAVRDRLERAAGRE